MVIELRHKLLLSDRLKPDMSANVGATSTEKFIKCFSERLDRQTDIFILNSPAL